MIQEESWRSKAKSCYNSILGWYVLSADAERVVVGISVEKKMTNYILQKCPFTHSGKFYLTHLKRIILTVLTFGENRKILLSHQQVSSLVLLTVDSRTILLFHILKFSSLFFWFSFSCPCLTIIKMSFRLIIIKAI